MTAALMYILSCTDLCVFHLSVGIIPPRTKSPTADLQRSFTEVTSRVHNGLSRVGEAAVVSDTH